ncbi:MAG: AMP-binding protein, partial [Alphaproteobacteria bacterium]
MIPPDTMRTDAGDINIGRFLSKRAQFDGDRVGLIVGDRRLTFRDLNTAANQAAHALLELGVTRGERVAVLMRNGVQYLATYYGCAKIGAILCGINWRLAAPEIDHVLRDSEASILIYDPEFAPAVDALPSPAPKLLPATARPNVPGTAFDALCAIASRAEPESLNDIADTPLVLVYTSGTTGHPKGAVLTHRQMFWSSTTMAASHDYHWGDVSLVPTPLFHVGGLSFATLFVHLGATLLVLPAWEPGAVLKLIAREKVNHFFAVPAMLRGLLEHADFPRTDLSSVRWILSGGAPMPVELIRAFEAAGIRLQQTYGATETAGPATLVDLGHTLSKAGSIGLPYFHT